MRPRGGEPIRKVTGTSKDKKNASRWYSLIYLCLIAPNLLCTREKHPAHRFPKTLLTAAQPPSRLSRYAPVPGMDVISRDWWRYFAINLPESCVPPRKKISMYIFLYNAFHVEYHVSRITVIMGPSTSSVEILEAQS